jgi:hypothetical protein
MRDLNPDLAHVRPQPSVDQRRPALIILRLDRIDAYWQ